MLGHDVTVVKSIERITPLCNLLCYIPLPFTALGLPPTPCGMHTPPTTTTAITAAAAVFVLFIVQKHGAQVTPFSLSPSPTFSL